VYCLLFMRKGDELGSEPSRRVDLAGYPLGSGKYSTLMPYVRT
jgi:hypothetical protein